MNCYYPHQVKLLYTVLFLIFKTKKPPKMVVVVVIDSCCEMVFWGVIIHPNHKHMTIIQKRKEVRRIE